MPGWFSSFQRQKRNRTTRYLKEEPSNKMRRLFHILSVASQGFGLVLVCLVMTCRAQVDGPGAKPTPPVERILALQQAETKGFMRARTWARLHALPTSIPQQTGWVQLVSVDDTGPVYLVSHNEMAAQITRTDQLYPGGVLDLNLRGQGLTLGLWDGGLALPDHQEFQGRIRALDPAEISEHATHIGGTLIAAGIEPGTRGMAYAADLQTRDWTLDTAELAEAAHDQNLLVSSHPYGPLLGWHFGDLENQSDQWYWLGDLSRSVQEDVDFGRYAGDTKRLDEVTWHHPYVLPVVSAGNDRNDKGPVSGTYRALDPSTNTYKTYSIEDQPLSPDGDADGYDTLGSLAVAKNTLTVGSLAERAEDGTASRASTFSAYGPTDDGRIKPDLVANGEGVYSTSSTGSQVYARLSGTSMASANVAGSLLLLQQYHEQITGRPMRAASLKGLVLHTAQDQGPPGPDYQFGWGLFDAAAAAQHLSNLFSGTQVLLEHTLSTTTPFYSTQLEVSERGPVRITLSWTDREAEVLPDVLIDNPSPRLIHDLDLRLIRRATREVFEPFILDPDQPALQAQTGDNTLDVVEQIFLPNAEPDTYTLKVGWKNPSSVSQPFSLLVSGVADQMRAVTVTAFRRTLTPLGVQFDWGTLREADTGIFILERAEVPSDTIGAAYNPSFFTVGEIQLSGGSEGRSGYQLVDKSVSFGRYIYRLVYQSAVDERSLLAWTQIDVPLALMSPLGAETRPAHARVFWTIEAAFGDGTFKLQRVEQSRRMTDTLEVDEDLPLRGPFSTEKVYDIEDRHLNPGHYRYILDLYSDTGERVARKMTDVEIISPVTETLVTYPNPFSNRVQVELYTPIRSRMKVTVYDALGRIMTRLVDDEWLPVSWHIYTLNTQDWTPGLYFLQVTSSEGTNQVRSIVCL